MNSISEDSKRLFFIKVCINYELISNPINYCLIDIQN